MAQLHVRTRIFFTRLCSLALASMTVTAASAHAAVTTFTQVVAGQRTCGTTQAAQPISDLFGSAGTFVPLGDLAACGISGSSNVQSAAGSGPLSETRALGATTLNSTFGVGSFTGSASARAEGHTVGARAQASNDGPTDGFSVVGADAFAQYRDSFVAMPDAARPAGTVGSVMFRINFDGAVEMEFPSGSGSGSARASIVYQQNTGSIFELVSLGVTSTGNFITAPRSGGESTFEINVVPGESVSQAGSASYMTFSMPFEYGKSFDFSLALLATVQPRVRTTVTSDFLATAILDGMLVFDDLGRPVTDFQFTSGAGITYDESGRVAPVPVPAAGWLMAAATVGLLRLRRRQAAAQ